nr:hexokinase-2 [Parasteatoda tepidariorum]
MSAKSIIFNNVGCDLKLNIDASKMQLLKSVTDDYLLADDIIKKINDVFESEMQLGLMKNPPVESSLQMANTFIPKHLSGDEKGEFLALDLGGTNFRVLLLKLDDPNADLDSIVKYYTVPEELRLGEGVKLFEFLADCIFDFLEANNLIKKRLPLGFCFSFPMIQTSIDEGILVTWTKSFNCKNVVGHEVVKMLKAALARRKDVAVDVVAVVNDATGTMMMGSYLDKRAAVGLILGTGCNAAYFEKVNKIEKWEGNHPGVEEVLIDIEWGAFGDNGVLDFMKTDVDKEIDLESLLPHSFTFEKLFAGRYIGSIAKKVICKLIEKGVLFGLRKDLPKDWIFTAADVSNTLEETSKQVILDIMKSKGFNDISEEDAEILHYVCTIISIRGALLVSICLANCLRRMNKEDVTIAIDGSLFKLHPKYAHYMNLFIAALAPKHKFQLILAEDGSGKGAGLVAAVVTSLNTSVLHN